MGLQTAPTYPRWQFTLAGLLTLMLAAAVTL